MVKQLDKFHKSLNNKLFHFRKSSRNVVFTQLIWQLEFSSKIGVNNMDFRLTIQTTMTSSDSKSFPNNFQINKRHQTSTIGRGIKLHNIRKYLSILTVHSSIIQ